MDPFQVAFSLAGVVIVIFGCYYVTYYVGLKASGQGRKKSRIKGRNISLLDRFSISKDKSFCIVEIAGRIYIIGVTNNSMTVIDTLDPDEYAQHSAQRSDAPSWHIAPGGQFGGKLTSKLASFIAGKIGKARTPESRSGAEGGTFSDSMRSAQEADLSGPPDRTLEQLSDSPEGDE